MRASAVRLYFALLLAESGCVLVSEHDRAHHVFKAAALLLQHLGKGDSVWVWHSVSPPFFEWLCCVCSQTRLGPGPRQQGRQVQEEGSPPLERSGSGVEGAERSGGLHKRSAEDWGASCRAPGTESLRRHGHLAPARSAETAFVVVPASRGGRCGRERPAEVGDGRQQGRPKSGRRHHPSLATHFA